MAGCRVAGSEFLGRVGFLRTMGAEVGFFIRLRKSKRIIFYIAILSCEFLLVRVEMVLFILKLLLKP